MEAKPLAVALSFLIALPVGWSLGDLRGSIPDAVGIGGGGGPANRPNRESISTVLDCSDLIKLLEAVEARESMDGADVLVNLLEEWSEGEIRSALEQTLRTPQCVARSGAERRWPATLFAAWMGKNPDAAVVWIDTLRSSALKDDFVRLAVRNWPKEQSKEGVDFLLAHHWRPDENYSEPIIRRALESASAGGVADFELLLEKFHGARINIILDSISLPVGFDFHSLIETQGFRSMPESGFQDVVLAEWRNQQPERFLEWVADTGSWEHLDACFAKDQSLAPVARFWEKSSPEVRQSMMDHLDWKRLGLEGVSRFANEVQGDSLREALLEDCVAKSFHSEGVDPFAVLQLHPSKARQGEILRSIYPRTDFTPEGPVRFSDPQGLEGFREKVHSLGILVPPPMPVDPGNDPFAEPQ